MRVGTDEDRRVEGGGVDWWQVAMRREHRLGRGRWVGGAGGAEDEEAKG
jgi:hypothetical protein